MRKTASCVFFVIKILRYKNLVFSVLASAILPSAMSSESALIAQYIAPHTTSPLAKNLLDDTALLPPLPPNAAYAISTDTIVEHIHTLPSSTPQTYAQKILAANLSDLAAQAAQPLAILLSLTIPKPQAETFIKEFSPPFAQGCKKNNLLWLGGDLTTTPHNICISATIIGRTQKNIDPKRANAQNKDLILATGELGEAALGLKILQETQPRKRTPEQQKAAQRYNSPTARWKEALRIAPYAHAMMDISDGLAADLTKLCSAAQLGADLYLPSIPIASSLLHTLPAEQALALALVGGEDFELLLTAPPETLDILQKKAAPLNKAPPSERLNKNKGIYPIPERRAKKNCLPPLQHTKATTASPRKTANAVAFFPLHQFATCKQACNRSSCSILLSSSSVARRSAGRAPAP